MAMDKHILLANNFTRGKVEYDLDGIIWRAAFEYLIQNYRGPLNIVVFNENLTLLDKET